MLAGIKRRSSDLRFSSNKLDNGALAWAFGFSNQREDAPVFGVGLGLAQLLTNDSSD